MQHEVNPGNFSLATRVARWAPYRAALLHATKVQASSKAMMRELELVAGALLTRNLLYIPEFYSKEKFPRAVMTREWSEDVEKVLFYPAQAWAHKNHLFLIRALGEAQKKLNVRFRLVLCGKDFGKLDSFRAAAAEARLALDHRGVVSDDELLECYRSCWAVVLPTRYESSSLPAIEAFAVGALIIASDIPPLREFSDTVPVVLFADDDVVSFVEAIQYALANEASLRKTMDGAFLAFERAYEIENVTKVYTDELLAH
jgi:glycosyltransferase involved in cell wall biosynthesis